jgi:Ca2+-binding EF-hand superfamily protein
MGSCVPKSSLSADLKKLAVEVFGEMDTDGNKCIDINETLKFWKDNYAKINTQAMFGAVDEDKNQKIDLDEWIKFWIKVKKMGNSDDDIEAELQNIRQRGSWVGFKGLKSMESKKFP